MDMEIAPFTITYTVKPRKIFGLAVSILNARILALPNSHSVKLEGKTATWLLWIPYASESTGKEGTYCAD